MTETPTESKEVAKRPVALGAKMGDLDAAYRLSKALAMAKMMPDGLQGKPSDVLALMLYGQDLGLTPMQSIQGIYVVKGKPQISGQLWIALAKQRGHRVFVPCRDCGDAPEKHPAAGHAYVRDHDATRCTIKVVRGDTGEMHAETFTIDDARTAKLLTNDNWTKYPKRMLLWRAATDCLRFLAPEIALGFYTWGDDVTDDAPAVEQVDESAVVADGQTVESKVTQVRLKDEIGQLADEFDFSRTAPQDADDEPVEPEPADDYVCEQCGAVGQHFEEYCTGAVS
ncbi:MAG: hypothetical protein JWO11_4119 [Nocardioides sp.]|nr:hypothetical protein [Nocardioides sp.]